VNDSSIQDRTDGLLKTIFGFDDYRPGQQEIIAAVLILAAVGTVSLKRWP